MNCVATVALSHFNLMFWNLKQKQTKSNQIKKKCGEKMKENRNVKHLNV